MEKGKTHETQSASPTQCLALAIAIYGHHLQAWLLDQAPPQVFYNITLILCFEKPRQGVVTQDSPD